MPVTSRSTERHIKEVILRYEETVEGSHGRTSVHGAPFHVVISNSGRVEVHQYNASENNHIKLQWDEVGALIELLQSATQEVSKMRETHLP